MKTQITKTLELVGNNYHETENGFNGLCQSFVQAFFPNQDLPHRVKVSASIRSWAFKGAKKIWIRHQALRVARPSSWTWEENGTAPNGFEDGGGIYEYTARQVKLLLGDKFDKMSPFWSDNGGKEGIRIPVYVRVVKA